MLRTILIQLKTQQRIAKTLDKKLVKNSLIYKSIDPKEHKSDNEDLKR